MTPPNVSATYTLLSAPMAMPYGWFIRSVSEDPTRTRQSFFTSDGGPFTAAGSMVRTNRMRAAAGGAGHAGDNFPAVEAVCAPNTAYGLIARASVDSAAATRSRASSPGPKPRRAGQ